MNYQIDIPRASFDGLCSFLQLWGGVYSQPGAVVLKGSQRNHKGGRGSAVDHEASASTVATQYNVARCALGRAKVKKNEAILDLRDLSEDEQGALLFVAACARLKPQQHKVMDRFKATLDTFLKLPPMVRIALAAKG